VGLCARRLAILACLLAPTAVHAQLAPVGVPAGVFRADLDGSMDIWDHQWHAGDREPLSAHISSPAAGSDILPSLSDADARIGRIIGQAGYRLNLGALSADAQAEDSRLYIGGAIGLTKGITIFGRMPIVRVRVQTHYALDPTAADAGITPNATEQDAFFQQFDASLGALSARIAAGDFDADPAQKASAQAALDAGGALRSDLFGLLVDPLTASPFVPTATSTAGTGLTAQVTNLQSSFASDFGVSGFTATPVLPTQTATTESFLAAISDPAGSVGLRTGETLRTYRGDAETGVAITLVDHWDRGKHRGGFRAAIEGLVRLPTGGVAQPDRVLTLGTGDGQTDLEGRLTTDLGAGRWGLRAEGLYTRQSAANYLVRVAPPTQPLAPITLLSAVRRDPGDVVSVAVRPFFRLAPTFAIQGTAMYWKHGQDEVTYLTPEDEIPGVSASVVGEDSKASATLLGIGVTYSNPGKYREGGSGLPVDASWSYERIVSATDGILPDRHGFRARFRAYFQLF